jgi:hypothetical protein
MIKDTYGNPRFYGVYRGVVKDNADPLNKGRVKVQVPQVLSNAVTEWAWPVNTLGVTLVAPELAQGVWVMFEGGDPSYPVWLGTFGEVK